MQLHTQKHPFAYFGCISLNQRTAKKLVQNEGGNASTLAYYRNGPFKALATFQQSEHRDKHLGAGGISKQKQCSNIDGSAQCKANTRKRQIKHRMLCQVVPEILYSNSKCVGTILTKFTFGPARPSNRLPLPRHKA